mmetsp:Transcript_433/g.774  ORF Transcript_433/g.774 Transcript_433/m.774 type:complete len:314 (+) Transcript_433:303-1244(+)
MDPVEVYKLEVQLGEGTFGKVFLARHNRTKKYVAIKMVHVGSNTEDRNRLEEEINILRECESPSVVEYYGAYNKNEEIWIVMEFCEAGSVADLMMHGETCLEEDAICHIAASVLLGLEYLHATNLIHRDIKAGNILLTFSGQAKLADFGVAARLTTIQSQRATVTGAPFWMAPEMAEPSQYGRTADIWSLGITIIEMAQGQPPRSDIHPMRVIFVIASQPSPTLAHPEHWSPEISSFIARCLVKDPARRDGASALMNHPFIETVLPKLLKNNLKSKVLVNLVKQNIDKIEAGRESRRQASRGGGVWRTNSALE